MKTLCRRLYVWFSSDNEERQQLFIRREIDRMMSRSDYRRCGS